MRVCYTALPGIVTVQLNGVDMRVRPNALRTIGKVVKSAIADWATPTQQQEKVNVYQPGSHIILSSSHHDPLTCPYYRTRILGGSLHSYYCRECAIPYDGVSNLHVLQPPHSRLPSSLPELPMVDNDVPFAVSPNMMFPLKREPRHRRVHSAALHEQRRSRRQARSRSSSLDDTLPHHRHTLSGPSTQHANASQILDYPTFDPTLNTLIRPGPRSALGLKRPPAQSSPLQLVPPPPAYKSHNVALHHSTLQREILAPILPPNAAGVSSSSFSPLTQRPAPHVLHHPTS
eukprot:Blabericola_migrator_1__6450@NODE_3254_length_1907_cov_133_324457_g2036_i0_p1_GENE_NODE_3254_length_1907_cov_133_324457_g2036_i0NODE_3254_length_1907_cov_133_324457_g2036_i0_p1_ORF_typecomplete_len288_score6_01_NODE_3254_length_1907_cov_133_324457_g2036_i08631726